MANIITELHLEMSDNWYVSKKLNSVGRVGENTVTKLIIEPTEILDNVTYEIEIMSADGSKNVAELTIDGTELYLILTANMLTTSGITKMQVRGLFTDGSIKKSNIFELKVNRSISATEVYEEYAVTIFDQLVQDCRDIIEGAESYAVRAETAAVNAEAYSESASASAESASASATTASTASTAAVNAATSAETSATSASTSAETASTAATSASASAANASTSAQSAQTAANTATTASETAVNASNTATSAATSAESSATSATTAANNASASATAASTSATNAAISETNASTSATNASTSETNAASSATSAANSATSASTSATNAANSATAAATSATNAHTSEVNASTSETNASASATEAAETAESIAASVAQINENTYRINDLEAIIAGYQQADLPTGAVASVTDGTALLMPSLKVGIEPVQEGSGDPSPDNIRPISGWTAANVTVSPTTSAEDGTTVNVQFTDGDNPLTVYGGTLDVTTGELVVDRGYLTNDYLVNTADYESAGRNCYVLVGVTLKTSGASVIDDKLIASALKTSTQNDLYTNYKIGVAHWWNTRIAFSTGDSTITSKQAFKEWLALNGSDVCYELATPTTYHLTPTQIRTLVGNNNIWADTGDIIEGKYFRSLT